MTPLEEAVQAVLESWRNGETLALIDNAMQDLRECLDAAVLDQNTPEAQAYLTAARVNYEDGGTLEFDDEPKVSMGEDGAYVQCWRWIYKSEMEKYL